MVVGCLSPNLKYKADFIQTVETTKMPLSVAREEANAPTASLSV